MRRRRAVSVSGLSLWCRLGLGLLLMFITAGSAGAGDDDAAAMALKQRAEQLWKAYVGDDWGTVHDLLSPEEQALATRDAYATHHKERGPFLYLSAQVSDAAVEGDTGWVLVEYSWRPRQYPIKPETVTRWQLWLHRNDWRPVPQPVVDQYPSRPQKVRPADEERALAARVAVAWRAQEAGDFAALYELLSPEYRGAVSRDEFLTRRAQYLYLAHTLEWTEVNEHRGRVKLEYRRKLNDPTLYKLQPETSTTLEDWVKIDGQWFRYLEPPKGSH